MEHFCIAHADPISYNQVLGDIRIDH
jgi:hypothetical protein